MSNGPLFVDEYTLASRLGISAELLDRVHKAESIRCINDPQTGRMLYDYENAVYCLRVYVDGQDKIQA